VVFAFVVTVLAMAIGAVVSLAVLGGLAYGGWQVAKHAVPMVGSRKRRGERGRRMRDEASAWNKRRQLIWDDSPVEVLRRRYAAGEIGQTEFRTRLVELLKERYVRGDLTLSEYEARVSSVLLDPALRSPGV
jgi:hypothetical protein